MSAKKRGKILSGGHKGSRAGRASVLGIGYRGIDVKLLVRWGIRRKTTSSPKRLKPPLTDGFAAVSTHGRSVAEIIVPVGTEFKRKYETIHQVA